MLVHVNTMAGSTPLIYEFIHVGGRKPAAAAEIDFTCLCLAKSNITFNNNMLHFFFLLC